MSKEEYLLPGDLFDALSSPIRLQVLSKLRSEPMNSSKLAALMDMTIQALQRHTDGLVKSGLIVRHLDGTLGLTAVGDASLEQLPSFLFLSKYRTYFQDHTFSGIPKHLIQRIGELNNCEFVADAAQGWQKAKDMVTNSEKFLYTMTTMLVNEFYVTAKDLLKKGIRFKNLHPEDMTVAKGFSKARQENGWLDAISDGNVEELYVKHLPVTTVISDKASLVLFANKKTDFIDGNSLFYSEHPDFRNWCLELFKYYWDEVEKVPITRLQEV